jgi:YgiT-type zinc finger domain-containing protein
MEKSESSYTVNRPGFHLLLDNIPVYICSRCNQRYYEDKEVEAIQTMIKHLEADLLFVQNAV